MRNLVTQRPARTLALIGVFGTLLGLVAVTNTSGQEGSKLPSVVRQGYTRPGSPSDKITDKGTLNRVVYSDKFKGIGGTVYFTVLKLTGDDGDSWGTGEKGFNKSFAAGTGGDGKAWPALDTKAKYLYLYQVVNDRGLDPVEAKPAGVEKEFGTQPIAGALIRLTSPDDVTSWGSFAGKGFVVNAPDVKFDNTPAAVGGKNKIMAVSALPSVLGTLPNEPAALKYQDLAGITDLKQDSPLAIGSATAGLGASWAVDKLRTDEKNKIKLAGWAKEMLQASESAAEPTVQVKSMDVGQKLSAITGKKFSSTGDQPVLVANFAKDALKLGRHSVLFGFTSNQPPAEAPVVIVDEEAAKAIPEAKIVPGIAGGTVVAPEAIEVAVDDKASEKPLPTAKLEGFSKANYPWSAVNVGEKEMELISTGKINGFGGTIFFAVLKYSGNTGDSWSTGSKDFDASFRGGIDLTEQSSPDLDTQAKYLYLYQAVNDRPIPLPPKKEGGIATASLKQKADKYMEILKKQNYGPLDAVKVPLMVDPHYITSWGYFNGQAFQAKVPENEYKTVAAAFGLNTQGFKGGFQTISASPHIADLFPNAVYKRHANAVILKNVLAIGSATQGLSKTPLLDKLKREGFFQADDIATPASAAEGIVVSAKHAYNPDAVKIAIVDMDEAFPDDLEIPEDLKKFGKKPLVFEADWYKTGDKDHRIPPGGHSVIFGFTTDLPPVIVQSILGGEVPPETKQKEKAAGQEGVLGNSPDGAEAAQFVAFQPAGASTGPSPAAFPSLPTPTPSGGGAPAGGGGGLGGAAGGGGLPGGGGLGGGLPGVGGGAGATTGGGGGGITGGGGGQQQQPQQQQQQQPGNTINITNTNTNTNTNKQSQRQSQSQHQSQHQNQHGHGNVVPGPGAALLGLLGLPALLFAYRRRKAANETVISNQ